MRLLLRLIVAILVIAGAWALVAAAMFMPGGISAKTEPGKLESALAPRLRSLAIPAAAKNTPNPVPASAGAVKAGMEHYADHCTICHANDGSGDTEMGRHLYPRVPDMRQAATQNLSDGELFYIIENGVKLTGMPAWGGEHGSSGESSWKLVHFIRHLPKLTPDELKEMKRLNPKGPDEQIDPDEFLKGGTPHEHEHKHGGEGK
jgi:mono/diheme cytochrome c family protein